MKDTFTPSQLDSGVSGGCEAAIHATRRFLENMPSNNVVVKIDFSNAFSCIRRDTVLAAVADSYQRFTVFCHYSLPPFFNMVSKPSSHIRRPTG